MQSAVDDDTLWRGRFGTSGGSGAKGAAKKERSPAKKERSPAKKERSPGKKERSPAKEERRGARGGEEPGEEREEPGEEGEEPGEEGGAPAARGATAQTRREGRRRRSNRIGPRARDGPTRPPRGARVAARGDQTNAGVDLGENDGARDESWLEDARARSEPAGKRKGVDDFNDDDNDEAEDESNPWFAPPSPDAEGSRLGAMPAAPNLRTTTTTQLAGGSRRVPTDGNESDTGTQVTSALRELEARELEEREVLGSNPQSAERRRRLEREEARELRELLRRQEERRRRRRRRLERRGEKVADFLPLFAAAALLGGAGRLVRGVFFGKKPGRR